MATCLHCCAICFLFLRSNVFRSCWRISRYLLKEARTRADGDPLRLDFDDSVSALPLKQLSEYVGCGSWGLMSVKGLGTLKMSVQWT